jgi:hypothetical protein
LRNFYSPRSEEEFHRIVCEFIVEFDFDLYKIALKYFTKELIKKKVDDYEEVEKVCKCLSIDYKNNLFEPMYFISNLA